jgi:hypothetical protein
MEEGAKPLVVDKVAFLVVVISESAIPAVAEVREPILLRWGN